ncbi:MAG: hypothetical protein KDD94_02235 [Calditrichaeota bacterium]|nr:hypothetical protein [Calditrichota bacterium]
MSQKMLSMLLKIPMVIFAVLLYFVIYIPAEIRLEEQAAKDLSRMRMEILSEAEKVYFDKNGKFTDNFNELLQTVSNDTTLSNKHLRVLLTQALDRKIEKFTLNAEEIKTLEVRNKAKRSNDVTYVEYEKRFDKETTDELKANIIVSDNIQNISKAATDIITVMEEVNDEYQSYDQILEKAKTVTDKVNEFSFGDSYKTFQIVAASYDSLALLRVNIEQYTLQAASSRSILLVNRIIEYVGEIEISAIESIWSDIGRDLKALELMLTDPSMKPQVKTNRYLRQLEITQKSIAVLKQLNLADQINELNKIKSQFEQLNSDFTSDYFIVTAENAVKGLEENEMLLVLMDQNTIKAPPVDDREFKMTVADRGYTYTIACPNEDTGSISRDVFFSLKYENFGNINGSQNSSKKSWKKD